MAMMILSRKIVSRDFTELTLREAWLAATNVAIREDKELRGWELALLCRSADRVIYCCKTKKTSKAAADDTIHKRRLRNYTHNVDNFLTSSLE